MEQCWKPEANAGSHGPSMLEAMDHHCWKSRTNARSQGPAHSGVAKNKLLQLSSFWIYQRPPKWRLCDGQTHTRSDMVLGNEWTHQRRKLETQQPGIHLLWEGLFPNTIIVLVCFSEKAETSEALQISLYFPAPSPTKGHIVPECFTAWVGGLVLPSNCNFWAFVSTSLKHIEICFL